jgi:hypothetical protein
MNNIVRHTINILILTLIFMVNLSPFLSGWQLVCGANLLAFICSFLADIIRELKKLNGEVFPGDEIDKEESDDDN